MGIHRSRGRLPSGIQMFSEAVSWLTHFFDELSQLTDSIGALIKPYIRYPDGTEALVYLEEWRSTSGKVEISEAVPHLKWYPYAVRVC